MIIATRKTFRFFERADQTGVRLTVSPLDGLIGVPDWVKETTAFQAGVADGDITVIDHIDERAVRSAVVGHDQ